MHQFAHRERHVSHVGPDEVARDFVTAEELADTLGPLGVGEKHALRAAPRLAGVKVEFRGNPLAPPGIAAPGTSPQIAS